jgi:hypothetical protein
MHHQGRNEKLPSLDQCGWLCGMRLCAYFAVTLRLCAIMMEHSGALFDIDNAENSVVTLYCY